MTIVLNYVIGRAKRALLVVQLALYKYYIYSFTSSASPDTVSFLNVSTRFYLSVDAVRNIAILYSRSPTMLKHSSSKRHRADSAMPRNPAKDSRPSFRAGARKNETRASPPSTYWHESSSVSPDTVSLLNISTRFYLGVHAVRNIATTVYGSRRKQHHRPQTLGPSSARVETTPGASANEEHVGLYVGS